MPLPKISLPFPLPEFTHHAASWQEHLTRSLKDDLCFNLSQIAPDIHNEMYTYLYCIVQPGLCQIYIYHFSIRSGFFVEVKVKLLTLIGKSNSKVPKNIPL